MGDIYFSHDADARTDLKHKALIKKYGMTGYGAFWVVVENLRKADSYSLPCKAYVYEGLAGEFVGASFDAEAFIHDCIVLELLETDGEKFWSPSLVRRMKKMEAEAEKKRNAALARWGKEQGDTKNMHCNADAEQCISDDEQDDANIKVKEKEKENILENTAQAAPKCSYGESQNVKLTCEEYQKLVDEFGVIKVADMITQLDDYIGSKGKRYKSHYHTIRMWIRREDKQRDMTRASPRKPGFGDFSQREYTEEELARLIDNRAPKPPAPADDFCDFQQRNYTKEELDKLYDN